MGAPGQSVLHEVPQEIGKSRDGLPREYITIFRIVLKRAEELIDAIKPHMFRLAMQLPSIFSIFMTPA
jgi:hypothetical protein